MRVIPVEVSTISTRPKIRNNVDPNRLPNDPLRQHARLEPPSLDRLLHRARLRPEQDLLGRKRRHGFHPAGPRR